jgi:hypothetical protein
MAGLFLGAWFVLHAALLFGPMLRSGVFFQEKKTKSKQGDE